MTPLARQLCARMAPAASSIGRLAESHAAATLGAGQRLEAARPHLDDLAQDRHGDLGRRLGADVEADRAVDAGELLVGDAGLGQPLLALGMGAPAAQRADIEGIRLERRLERRIVELGIVRQA